MTPFTQALETSVFLAEKIASARPASATLREKLAMADFAAFGLFKRAAFDPAALSALQKGLGWGVGLGVPALGVGHMMLGDAKRHSADVLRDARNQALLTAAGVGSMQALGDIFRGGPKPSQSSGLGSMVDTGMSPATTTAQKLAAAIMVDDVLEDGCYLLDDPSLKHAMLVQLVRHRSDATSLLRSLLP
jgi:hypothetical protein